MAKKSVIAQQERLNDKRLKAISTWIKAKKPTKYYNRCKVCGRTGSYIREFGICRVCFRKYAREWLIMWVRKASW